MTDDDGRPKSSEHPAGEPDEDPGHGDSAAGPGQPERDHSQQELLRTMQALRREARAARHAYWFPLITFGLLTCVSIPFYLQPAIPHASAGNGTVMVARGAAGPWLPFLGGYPDLAQGSLAYYWLAALVGGLLLTLAWYRWHAHRIGLQTPARGYLVTTAVLVIAAIAIPLLSLLRSPHWLRFMQRLHALWPGDLVIRGTFPFLIIAIGLMVLAWAERSRALTVIAAVYTAAALVASLYNVSNMTYRLGWNPGPADQSVPNVLLPALVLLVAGTGAFLAQRQRRTAG